MNYLYLIGGAERSGKTTILNKILTKKPMIAVQTDAIRDSLKRSVTGDVSQGELVWNTILGLISYYDNKSIDLIIEGIEITSERIKSLNLKNLLIKSVFVGFTEVTNFDKAIAGLGKDGFKVTDLDKDLLKKRFDEHVEKGKKIAISADANGFRFFSFDNNDFESYCSNVINYLLE